MGGLGKLGFGWALSMRLTVSGLGCGLEISSERAICSIRLNVILVYVRGIRMLPIQHCLHFLLAGGKRIRGTSVMAEI
jgi:hypothetical protein